MKRSDHGLTVCARSGTSGAWGLCCFGRLRVKIKIKKTPNFCLPVICRKCSELFFAEIAFDFSSVMNTLKFYFCSRKVLLKRLPFFCPYACVIGLRLCQILIRCLTSLFPSSYIFNIHIFSVINLRYI